MTFWIMDNLANNLGLPEVSIKITKPDLRNVLSFFSVVEEGVLFGILKATKQVCTMEFLICIFILFIFSICYLKVSYWILTIVFSRYVAKFLLYCVFILKVLKYYLRIIIVGFISVSTGPFFSNFRLKWSIKLFILNCLKTE